MKKYINILAAAALMLSVGFVSCETPEATPTPPPGPPVPPTPGGDPEKTIKVAFVSSNERYPIAAEMPAGAWVAMKTGMFYFNDKMVAAEGGWEPTSPIYFADDADYAAINVIMPYNEADKLPDITRSVSTAPTAATIAAEQFWIGTDQKITYNGGQASTITMTPWCDVINVTLVPGAGITQAELDAAAKSIKLKASTTAKIDLFKIDIAPTNVQSITMMRVGNKFSALVPAQTFSSNYSTFTVTVGDHTASIKLANTTASKDMYDMTLKFNNEKLILDDDIFDFIDKPLK